MLTEAVESYLAVRRACGFALHSEGHRLNSFAVFSGARGEEHVCSRIAIEWAGLARTLHQRARRLGEVIRFARYMRAGRVEMWRGGDRFGLSVSVPFV